MGKEPPWEMFESGLDHRLPLEQRRIRAMNRRAFRQMIKEEIVDHPLTWRRRRALERFAARLPIDAFEARLIIRGVEYECGHAAPAAMDDAQTAVKTEYVARPVSMVDWLERALVIPVILILIALLIKVFAG